MPPESELHGARLRQSDPSPVLQPHRRPRLGRFAVYSGAVRACAVDQKDAAVLLVDLTMEPGDRVFHVPEDNFVLPSSVLRNRTDVRDLLVQLESPAFVEPLNHLQIGFLLGALPSPCRY